MLGHGIGELVDIGVSLGAPIAGAAIEREASRPRGAKGAYLATPASQAGAARSDAAAGLSSSRPPTLYPPSGQDRSAMEGILSFLDLTADAAMKFGEAAQESGEERLKERAAAHEAAIFAPEKTNEQGQRFTTKVMPDGTTIRRTLEDYESVDKMGNIEYGFGGGGSGAPPEGVFDVFAGGGSPSPAGGSWFEGMDFDIGEFDLANIQSL